MLTLRQAPTVTILFLLLGVQYLAQVEAFQVSPSPSSSATREAPRRLNYATVADPPLDQHQPAAAFRDRMRKLVLTDRTIAKPTSPPEPTKTASAAPDNVHRASNFEDFKRLVLDETDKLTVVRFYAPWCRACRRSEPMFDRLTRQYPDNVQFVHVPVSDSTKALIEALEVPTLPYAHVYHPSAGLVEERSASRKYFGDFASLLDSYVRQECSLPDEEDGVDPDDSGVFVSPYQSYAQRQQQPQLAHQL